MTKKDLHTELIALCDYALIDQKNKLSVMGIFNELNVTTFPGGLSSAYFVATIIGEANTAYKLTIQVQDEDKKDVFPPFALETKTSFAGKNNLLVAIGNFVFPHAGEYKVSIQEGKKEVGSTQLHVMQANAGEKKYEYTN